MNTEPLNLLLIEDYTYDVKVIRLMLASRHGESLFDFRAAESLKDGIVALKASLADVVLLDLNLPDSTGLDTFRRINEHFPQIPIIIVSATDDLDLAIEAVQLGAQDYLQKGEISRNLLMRAIYHAVERHSILQKLINSAHELANSEARWRMIADKSSDGIAIVDADGSMLFVNPAALYLLRFSNLTESERTFPYPLPPENLMEMTFRANEKSDELIIEMESIAIEWEGEPKSLVILRDISTRKKVEIELQQAKDDLESVVKARTSELNKANEYLLDQISERRRAQRALNRALTEAEQARDQIDTIFASVADGLLATDRHNRITMMNRAAEEVLEVSWANAVGQSIDSVVDNETLLSWISTTLKEGQALQFEFEMPLYSANSESASKSKIIRARSAVVEDRAHNSSGVITVMYDVTREREVDRLKTEFISTAAHELRTPITTVQGFSEILMARDDLSVEVRKKYLSYINNQAVALARIVDDLLNLAKMESGHEFVLNKEPITVGSLVRGVVNSMHTESTLHTFLINLNDDELKWVVDRPKMMQVLENLLENAVKFAPNGGHIEIAGQSYADPQSGQRFYFLSVKDEGIGMTLTQVSHIFDQFYRGDASNTALGGAGLSMTIVKHIIEAHGGRIWVDSALGKGTKVSFTVLLE